MNTLNTNSTFDFLCYCAHRMLKRVTLCFYIKKSIKFYLNHSKWIKLFVPLSILICKQLHFVGNKNNIHDYINIYNHRMYRNKTIICRPTIDVSDISSCDKIFSFHCSLFWLTTLERMGFILRKPFRVTSFRHWLYSANGKSGGEWL